MTTSNQASLDHKTSVLEATAGYRFCSKSNALGPPRLIMSVRHKQRDLSKSEQ
jgi:hypothetical protein